MTQGKDLYERYAIPRELRLVRREWKYLVDEIRLFAEHNKVPDFKQKEIFDKFHNASVIEIGGCYSGDSEYLAIKNNLLMMISCGCWD